MQLGYFADSYNLKQKKHCLINVNMFSNHKLNETTASKFDTQGGQFSHNKGRVMVYHEKESHTNKFKYVGSGDLTFVSMRIK